MNKNFNKPALKRLKKKNVMRKPMEIANGFSSEQDPLGSYTGVPTDGTRNPTQDTDDL